MAEVVDAGRRFTSDVWSHWHWESPLENGDSTVYFCGLSPFSERQQRELPGGSPSVLQLSCPPPKTHVTEEVGLTLRKTVVFYCRGRTKTKAI